VRRQIKYIYQSRSITCGSRHRLRSIASIDTAAKIGTLFWAANCMHVRAANTVPGRRKHCRQKRFSDYPASYSLCHFKCLFSYEPPQKFMNQSTLQGSSCWHYESWICRKEFEVPSSFMLPLQKNFTGQAGSWNREEVLDSAHLRLCRRQILNTRGGDVSVRRNDLFVGLSADKVAGGLSARSKSRKRSEDKLVPVNGKEQF